MFDATPPDVAAVKWSEQGPPVRPAQLLVAVELERDGERVHGLAAATRYLTPAETLPDAEAVSAVLEAHLGRPPLPWAGRSGPARNPYEPVVPGLPVLIELASLDAAGRLLGVPATAFLGGAIRHDLPAYASLPSFVRPADALACAHDALAAGFRAVKFHAAGDVETDVATVRRARLGSATGSTCSGTAAARTTCTGPCRSDGPWTRPGSCGSRRPWPTMRARCWPSSRAACASP